MSNETGSKGDEGQSANNDELLSDRSTVTSSTPTDTPATSFSSYGSVNGYNAEKSGMYKLSGKQLYISWDRADWCAISC